MHGLRKAYRDFVRTWGRTLTLLLALTTGALAFASAASVLAILQREMGRAYSETLPASATLEMEQVSPQLLQAVEARSEVLAATRRRTLRARYRTGDSEPWGSALVFIAEDLANANVARVFPEYGRSAPKEDQVLLERSAVPLLNAGLGAELTLELPGAQRTRVVLSGIVHEASLAPANTHAALYLYASPSVAKQLGVEHPFDELRVRFRGREPAQFELEEQAKRLATWIESQQLGKVYEIRVPPPRRHPHQAQLTAVLALLLVFALLLFALSTLLGASLVGSLMERQTREMGVLRTLGASPKQISRWYLLSMLALAFLSFLPAWLGGAWAAEPWAESVASLLNFNIVDARRPAWLGPLVALVTIAMPPLVALRSIRNGTRVPISEALRQRGLSTRPFQSASKEVQGAGSGGAWWAHVFRSSWRQRRRMGLSIALFALAGAITIAALSVSASWQGWAERLRQEQRHDLQVTLAPGIANSAVGERLARDRRVAELEQWASVPTSLAREGQYPVRPVYPDDEHGAFHLLATPIPSSLLKLPVVAGRWLRADDKQAVVINQLVPGFRNVRIGARLPLAVEGESLHLTVVGKVEQVGVGAIAYTTGGALEQLPPRGRSLHLRMRFAEKPPEPLAQWVESSLGSLEGSVASVEPIGVYENAMVAHFEILVSTLLSFSGLAAAIGALGLSAAVGVSIVQRTREIGVLRALGATVSRVVGGLVAEGTLMGGVSWALAIALGLGLARGLGISIGQLSFGLPLPFTVSVGGVLASGAAVVLLSFLVTWVAARGVSRCTVSEAVRHV